MLIIALPVLVEKIFSFSGLTLSCFTISYMTVKQNYQILYNEGLYLYMCHNRIKDMCYAHKIKSYWKTQNGRSLQKAREILNLVFSMNILCKFSYVCSITRFGVRSSCFPYTHLLVASYSIDFAIFCYNNNYLFIFFLFENIVFLPYFRFK